MRVRYFAILFCLVTGSRVALFSQIGNPKGISYDWKTDTTKHTVDLTDLSLAAPRDAVPTLNHPGFITRDNPNFKYFEHEPVIVLSHQGQAKAYPLSILTLYELANDSFGGHELMITYCPMCNAAIVFNREVEADGSRRLLNFGVSGILMHNDMVMYDKETESWWEQMMGNAIAGKLAGTSLEFMPSMLISVKDYFDRFPKGLILSPEGIKLEKRHGHRAFYHLEHDSGSLPAAFFIPEKTDPRLPPLERVLDIHIHDHTTIYPFHLLAQMHVVNDSFEGEHYAIFYHGETVSVLDEDKLNKSKHTGSATAFRSSVENRNLSFVQEGAYFRDMQTHSLWDITGYCREGEFKGKQLWLMPHSNHFAFAYLAFYPESEVYGSR